jgi:hypothetical protein
VRVCVCACVYVCACERTAADDNEEEKANKIRIQSGS